MKTMIHKMATTTITSTSTSTTKAIVDDMIAVNRNSYGGINKQKTKERTKELNKANESKGYPVILSTEYGDNVNINATATNIRQPSIGNSSNQIPSDILDDLASRFIINVPDNERNNLIRICFQIELAHWFYLDFFCSIEHMKLVPCGMKQFAVRLFQHIPFLRVHLPGIDKILEDWKEYKLSVPTYGAVLISEDLKHVLLVQSYWAKSSWGFPKGKVNEHEDPVHCAAREVYEEIGYDISNLIVPNDYIEDYINYQYIRLYLVRNIPLGTVFSPRTRNEIKCIQWFPVDALPTSKNDVISKQELGMNANSFFMIMPFIKRLKKWVNDNRCSIASQAPFQSISSNKASPPTVLNKIDRNKKRDPKMSLNQTNFAFNTSNLNKQRNPMNFKRQRHKSLGDTGDIKLQKFHTSTKLNSINIAATPTSSSHGLVTTTTFTQKPALITTAAGATTTTVTTNAFINPVANKGREKFNKSSFKPQFLINNNRVGNILNNSKASNAGIPKNIDSNNTKCSKMMGFVLKNQSQPPLQPQLQPSLVKKQLQKQQKNNFKMIQNSNLTKGNNTKYMKAGNNQQHSIDQNSKINNEIHNSPSDNILTSSSIRKSYQKFDIENNDDPIKKYSPNFDSWKSFKFTKNRISHVFC